MSQQQSRSGRIQWKRKLLQLVPRSLRFEVIRNSIRIADQLPIDLEYKLAETQEELEQAFELLYQSYLEFGYQEPNENKIRLVKYFALPTTSTLICKHQGRVVATLSVIRKTGLGLPMEKIFNLQEVEQGNKVIAEISSLAIDKTYRRSRGEMLIPLLKYMWEYITTYMQLDRMVIAVNPSMVDFYESVLMFQKINTRIIDGYDFVKSAPAVALWADIHELPYQFHKAYAHKTNDHNLHRYFTKIRFAHQFKFPHAFHGTVFDPVMTPELLSYFFHQKSNVFKALSEIDKSVLWKLYPDKSYQLVLPPPQQDHQKIETRFFSKLQAIDVVTHTSFQVLDLSLRGIKATGEMAEEGQVRMVRIQIDPATHCEIRIKVAWVSREQKLWGAEILKPTLKWVNYVQQYHNQFTLHRESKKRLTSP